jgi:hypothetical protein
MSFGLNVEIVVENQIVSMIFNPAKTKKVNKYFNIERQFQKSTTCRNDMMHTLSNEIAKCQVKIAQVLALAIFLSVSLVGVNLRGLREIFKTQNPTFSEAKLNCSRGYVTYERIPNHRLIGFQEKMVCY